MFFQFPCIICFSENNCFLTYFQFHKENVGNFVEICNKYQSQVENCTKTKFCFKKMKVNFFSHLFLYIFFLSPTHLICPSFWVRKIIIFEILAKKPIFHKCVPVTSGICRISTKIENQKIKLVPSLYGFGGSYKPIFFIILGIFVKNQKI